MGVYKTIVAIGLVALVLITGAALMINGASIPVLQPSGVVAEHQRDLFIFTALLSLAVVVPVFAMLASFAVRYRAGNTSARYEPDWSENKLLEGLWWGIPVIIIIVLAIVTWFTTHELDPYRSLAKPNETETKVQVIALRWKWLFFYPDHGVATLNYAPLPVDTPVQFVLTANAPMSAFWIPALGSQIYAMNSMESQLHLRATQVGTYTGYTTNINGEGYSKMTFETDVMTKESFNAWVASAKKEGEPLDRAGYEALSVPKSEHDKRTYTLTDDDLFDEISDDAMMKSHGHGAHHE